SQWYPECLSFCVCVCVCLFLRTDKSVFWVNLEGSYHHLGRGPVRATVLRRFSLNFAQTAKLVSLHCTETPVFAMPLLLVMDSWVECLFQATFYWEMKCSKCVQNTHRITILLPPVFALHFVEGLPNNDVSTYTFNFKGRNYSVTTVIQYKSHLKHFVTWTCSADGSWLEYDDLKYPDCKTHQKLQVPANEMHIVFWEVEDDKELHICSSSSTSALSDNERNNSLNEGSVADGVPSTEITQQGSLVSSTDNPPLSANESGPTSASLLDQNSRWSFLLSKHPLNQVQKSTAKFAPASDTQLKPPPPPPPFHSTPNSVKRPHLPMALYPKPQLRTEDSEDLPVKAADMYGAFRAKSLNNQRPLLSPTVQSQPVTSNHLTTPTVMSCTSLITPGAKALLKASLKRHGSHSSEVPVGLGSTEALRYKLLKQLKSRKKQLARINKMLDKHEGLQLRPDSTDLDSPSTVTSSTYDGATSDDFLSDLLSPATTASNLSPDSTGFFEMFANGPDGAERVVEAAGRPSELNGGMNGQHDENFLDEFLSQAASHTPTDIVEVFFSSD
uniref:Ubiquitin-specific peptidase-like SUMO isopeptidase domain-containing protein n=1 Tax=Haplochromis burtoni TaxID=8153 RepID=A0A3Q2WPE0_HAPBU